MKFLHAVYWQGYRYTIIHAGTRKADFHPHGTLTDEARAVLAAAVDRTFTTPFKDRYARNTARRFPEGPI